MTDKPTVGQFVSELLHAGKRRVAQSGNPAGYSALYPEVSGARLRQRLDERPLRSAHW
jgi:hypothetical protein